MGIASFLLGENNPFAVWAGQNQNTLGAIGAGLGQGQNLQGGLAAGLAAVPQAKQLDREAGEKLKAEKLAENQMNATANWLQANHPDLAQMVQAGMPVSEAWSTAMQRMQPEAAPKPIEINGQLVDPNTYDVLGDFRTPETNEGPAAPSGYRWGQGGGLEFIPGGPSDPANKGADMTQAEQRNQQLATVIAPELATVEKNWTALTDAGNQFAGTEVNGNRPGLAMTTPEYQQAINSLSTIVASYLYSVSGATATDEEIKRQVNLLTPKIGESKLSADQKLLRIQTYARAVAEAAGRSAPAAGGDDVDAILSGLGI